MAWKRVKANKGAAGVEGLDIEQTAGDAAHEVAADPASAAGGAVPARAGTEGDDPEAGRQPAGAGHPDGGGDAAAKRVAGNSRRWWRSSDGLLKSVLTIDYFDRLGLPRLS